MNNKRIPESEHIFQEKWYHSIELSPGRFTDGQNFPNIALTRTLLRGCSIENMNCLDIGAADFLITLLLLRRGASTVTAYDRPSNVQRAKLLKDIFNVNFEYISEISLSELPTIGLRHGLSPFDVVVFSGVLYHIFDPLGGLSIIRGLVRNGGLLVLETSAILDDKMAMYFNAEGTFYQYNTYWQISVECLDYLLRFLRLAPLDCLYLYPKKKLGRISSLKSLKNKLGRVGVVCRAVDHSIACAKDWWMQQSTKGIFDRDFNEFLDWNQVTTDNLPDVDYNVQNEYLSFRPDTNTVNLLKTIRNSHSLAINNPDEQIYLRLEAKW